MTWRQRLKADPLPWLMEPDNPSARYLALTELIDRPAHHPDVINARTAIPRANPVYSILAAQFAGVDPAGGPTGYWVKPDVGYSPKYRATVWQIIFLAQLGAPPIDPIRRACDYVLNHSRQLTDRRGNPDGRFVAGKGQNDTITCLNGNLIWAMARLGYGGDRRVVEAREATARAIVERGFACRCNRDLPCAWGAVKALRAFVEIPDEDRSATVRAAVEQDIEFLLSVPLLEATYPARSQVSSRWFELGFPLAYYADVLEVMTVLAQAKHGDHPYVQAGVEWLVGKQDPGGRWKLEQTPGKMWASVGRRGQPNKWVTLRALVLLKEIS